MYKPLRVGLLILWLIRSLGRVGLFLFLGGIMNTATIGISATENLHFAAYLDASGKLTFAGCIPAGVSNKVLFRFRDPRHEIVRLYEEYVTGAVVSAIDLSTTLRRAMSSTLTIQNTTLL